MLKIDNILHPTDFSDGAAAALDHVCHLARHFEAALHVLHVVPIFGDTYVGDDTTVPYKTGFEKRLQAEAEVNMAALIAAHSYPDVPLIPVLSEGVAAGPIIIDYATAENVDVVVVGTHGRRGIQHLLLGSVAEDVLHKAPCDVMSVRMLPGALDEARPIQRILVPLDLEKQSTALVHAARHLAAGYGAELHLLHVIRPLPYSVTMLTPVSIYELVPELSDKARTHIEALFAEAGGPDVPYTINISEGPVAKTIVEVAEDRSVDVICMASGEVSHMERLLVGSVTERVVRTASCPVYVAQVSTEVVSDTESEMAFTSRTKAQ